MTEKTINIDQLKELLTSKLEELDGILAPKSEASGVHPFLFTKETGLDGLALWPWYRWPTILTALQRSGNDKNIGVLVRGCDERALVEMHKRHQVDMNQYTLLGIPCAAADELPCFCAIPHPNDIIIGEKGPGLEQAPDVVALLEKTVDERLAYWRSHFDRCIKCYGCRNICPVCFCDQCVLEEDIWVDRGIVPPPMSTFHLIRAMHMATRCIGCGECEATCPSDIPMTTLYKLLARDMNELYGYVKGRNIDEMPPVNLKGVGEEA